MATIAIVGGGLSGTLVAIQLLRKAESSLSIILIEPRADLGTGIAYSTRQPEHLLNVQVKNMSLFPDDPDHFYRWLAALDPSVKAQDYVRRSHYGLYVRDTLRNALQAAPEGVTFDHIRDTAVNIIPGEAGASVRCQSRRIIDADAVVLAFGNFPPRNPDRKNTHFYETSLRYIPDSWANDLTRDLPSQSDLLLVGCGLTAVDVLLTLHKQGHQGKIHLVSRHGLLPLPHLEQPATPQQFRFDDLPTTPRDLLRFVRQQVECATAAGESWQSVIDGLRPHVNALWQRASDQQRRQFFTHVLPYWNIHRHRVPVQANQVLESLRASGQLDLQAGRVHSYHETSQQVEVTVNGRTGQQRTLSVQYVINCTGANPHYQTVEIPLIRQMFRQELCRPGILNLGLDTDEQGALIHADGQASSVLFTLGAARRK
jgi:uncharacterized NAD(P)/FAD-binding protein YdhS